MADALDLLIARGPAPQDFSGLGDLPKAYWEGLNQRHVQDLRDSFKGGVPLMPDGKSIDYAAMQKTLYQKGGLEQGTAFGNLDLGRSGIEALNQVEGGGQAAPAGAAPPVVSPSANRQPRPPQSPTGYTGGNNGQTTIDAILSQKLAADDPRYGPIKLRIAADLKVDPDQPLTPEQLNRISQGLAARPNLSGVPGGAAPAPQAPPAQVAQAAPQAQPGAYGPAATAASRGSVPTSVDPEIQEKIRKLTILAGSTIPSVAKAATTRLEALQKQAELTPLQKEYDLARRQGFTGTQSEYQLKVKGDETQAVESTKTYIEKYKGIQTAGERAADDIPKLQIARKLTEDPNFHSGSLEQYNLLVKRALVALGGDPNTAVPQEAFRKIISDSLIDNIKGLAGSGAGQVRVAEIKIMQQAAASTENTPQANRMLVEMAARAQQRLVEVARMAQNYNGGRLDAGFDRQVSAYKERNPLFSPAEISNFRQIIDAGGAKKGPPATAAQGVPQHFATPADLDKAIKAGTVKTGQKVSVPGGTIDIK